MSWSAAVLGSIATELTGSGNVIGSRTIGCSGSANVSPVEAWLSPTDNDVARDTASMSSGRWRVCGQTSDALLAILAALWTCAPGSNLPGVDAEVGQPAHAWIGDDLEDAMSRRRGAESFTRTLRISLGGLQVFACDPPQPGGRRREVGDDHVEQRAGRHRGGRRRPTSAGS